MKDLRKPEGAHLPSGGSSEGARPPSGESAGDEIEVGRFTIRPSVVLPTRFVVCEANGEAVVRKPRRGRNVKRWGTISKPGKPAIFVTQNDAIAFAAREEQRRQKEEK